MGLFDNRNEDRNEEVKPVVEEKGPEILFQEDQISEVAFISSSTKIDGNITTQGHLVLNGDIQGATTVKGNLVLNGTTRGEISCDSLLADAASSSSNVTALNNVVIKKDTAITGNINCKNITVYGTVHGDIIAKGSVVLKSTAVVNGNISAARIGIESGAKLAGAVSVK